MRHYHRRSSAGRWCELGLPQSRRFRSGRRVAWLSRGRYATKRDLGRPIADKEAWRQGVELRGAAGAVETAE